MRTELWQYESKKICDIAELSEEEELQLILECVLGTPTYYNHNLKKHKENLKKLLEKNDLNIKNKAAALLHKNLNYLEKYAKELVISQSQLENLNLMQKIHPMLLDQYPKFKRAIIKRKLKNL